MNYSVVTFLQSCDTVSQGPQGRLALLISNRRQDEFGSVLKQSCSILSLSFLHPVTKDLKGTDIDYLQWFDGKRVTVIYFHSQLHRQLQQMHMVASMLRQITWEIIHLFILTYSAVEQLVKTTTLGKNGNKSALCFYSKLPVIVLLHHTARGKSGLEDLCLCSVFSIHHQ